MFHKFLGLVFYIKRNNKHYRRKILAIVSPLITIVPILIILAFSIKSASSVGQDQGPYLDNANVNTYQGIDSVYALLRVGNIEYLGGVFGLEALDTTTGQKIDWDTGLPNLIGNIRSLSTINEGQLPLFLKNHTTVTANVGGTDYMYVLGGSGIGDQSTVYKTFLDAGGEIGNFDTANQGQLPQPLSGHTTVTANIGGTNYIYVLGGSQSTVYKATIDNNGDIGAFSTTNQGQLPQALYAHTTVTANVGGTDYIYVLGGQNDSSTRQAIIYKATIDGSGDIGPFSVNDKQLPQPLYEHTTISVLIGATNFIYVLGGENSSESILNTVYRSWITDSVPIVYSLVHQNNTLYAGTSNGLLAFDTATTPGILTANFDYLNSGTPGTVYALAIDGNNLYVGGRFTSTEEIGHVNLSSYDITSPPGSLANWQSDADGETVYALATGSGKLYVGGTFGLIQGVNQPMLAAILLNTNAVDNSFTPQFDVTEGPAVMALKAYNNRLYVGGKFTTINTNSTLHNLASLDRETGAPDSFSPATDRFVYSLSAKNNYLYAAEASDNQGSAITGSAQAFNLDTGNPAGWTPNDNQPTYAVDAGDNALYAGLGSIQQQTFNNKSNNQSAFLNFHIPVAEAAGKELADIGGLNGSIYLAEFDLASLTPTPTPTETPTPTPTETPTPTPTPSSNNNSSVSAPVCSDQKPGAPTGLSATAGPASDQITLSWTAPAAPVTDYSIVYSDNPSVQKWGVVSTGNVTSYVISGLNSNVKYYFWVNAVNGCKPGDLAGPVSIGSGTLGTSPVAGTASSSALNGSVVNSSITINPLPVTGPNGIIVIGATGAAMTILGVILILLL